jgi:hypothetical protein
MALFSASNRSIFTQACLLVLLLLSHESQGSITANEKSRYLRQQNRQLQNDDGANNNNGGGANYQDGTQPEICEDGIVQVTSIKTVCDSPYTFYYGNGANRNSESCNFGDKATIMVSFE